MKTIKLKGSDAIEIVFADGNNTATAVIPRKRLEELLMDEAYEIITKPDCHESTCAVNGFCECGPINEDMEFAGIFIALT